jgi:hypothetical protein
MGTDQKANQESKDILEAGTGFMLCLSEAIHDLENQGYTENLTLKVDHFESNSGENKIYTQDFDVDKVIRFENTSDPDDQAILYAIRSDNKGLKGLYVEGYGINQDEQSKEIIEKFKQHH